MQTVDHLISDVYKYVHEGDQQLHHNSHHGSHTA